jgi:NADPH2:quinone reductase
MAGPCSRTERSRLSARLRWKRVDEVPAGRGYRPVIRDGALPRTMNAVVVRASGRRGGDVALEEWPVPQLGPGEVLIRVAASPVNPSDVAFIEGRHPMKRALPAIPGWEGSGVVVAAGGGFLGRRLVGKRVAASDPDRNGFWAEYTVMLALHCLTLPDNVDDEHGAMALINPLTALGLLEQIEQLHA